MALLPENMIVLYRQGSADSLEFANYYADFRSLDPSQLVAVPCTGTEILANYATFQTQVQNAVAAYLATRANVNVILVGYGVPGGFIDGSDVISTTSRLSRINQTYNSVTTKGMSNPLFARQVFKRFDTTDAATAFVVSRIDAPTLDDAKKIVDNIANVAQQGVVNGKLFFDPYATTDDAEEIAYKNELLDFEATILPQLGIGSYKTKFWDSTTDVVIPRLTGDSFMWAWKADRAGYTFFKEQTTARVFLYNGDTDGAEAVRDAEDKRWPMLALASGYAGTAGAMSDPLPDGLLRPKPFFDALLRGATLGEAFLFAVPHLDWTLTLFGDPLLTVSFPAAEIIPEGYNVASGFESMGYNLQTALGYYLEREEIFFNIYSVIHAAGSMVFITELIRPFESVANDVIARTKAEFVRLVNEYVRFPRSSNEPLIQYLNTKGLKVSRLLPLVSPNIQVPASLRYPVGYWVFEDTIQQPSSEFTKYHFQLQLADDIGFTSLVTTGASYVTTDNVTINANSAANLDGWFYENEANGFSEITSQGVATSYAGRRVRYISPEDDYFPTRQVYYARIRQVNEFGQFTAWRTFKQVVGT